MEAADLEGGKWISGKCDGLGAQLLLVQPRGSDKVAQDVAKRSFSLLSIPVPTLQLRKHISLLLLIISWCAVEMSPSTSLRPLPWSCIKIVHMG